MLSSIHPLGERARQGRWGRTVISFTIGSVVAGVLVGALLGGLGALLLSSPTTTTLGVLGAVSSYSNAWRSGRVDMSAQELAEFVGDWVVRALS